MERSLVDAGRDWKLAAQEASTDYIGGFRFMISRFLFLYTAALWHECRYHTDTE